MTDNVMCLMILLKIYNFAAHHRRSVRYSISVLVLVRNVTLSTKYRGADKSLARPGRKQAYVSVINGVNVFRRLALQEKKLDDCSRLHVVEIARVSDMLPSLFLSWLG